MDARMTALGDGVAELSTKVDALTAQVAALPTAQFAELAALVAVMAAQVAALPTLADMQALLAPISVPALSAAVSARVLAMATARARNAHCGSDALYEAVACADGAPPAHWPAGGFTRAALYSGALGVVDELLADYGLPSGPPAAPFQRRNALAQHIGAAVA